MTQVVGFDHLVLLCRDVERTLAWYRDELGLTPERDDAWRAGEVLFPSLRVDATTVLDLLPGKPDGRNIDHLCLVLAAGEDPALLAASGRFDVTAGPMEVWGAQGMGTAVYVRDPDGMVVELRAYPAR
jgi:catechol 2,3-dioxygenase-like lactoylglutathione lyase family enzyme